MSVIDAAWEQENAKLSIVIVESNLSISKRLEAVTQLHKQSLD